MKKIIGGVVVLAAVAVGGVHWQLSRALDNVANGAQLQIGSATITVPPLHAQARTFFPPALSLDDVDVTVALGKGAPTTIAMQRAQLAVDIWTLTPRIESVSTAIRLPVADADKSTEDATLRGMVLGLDYHGQINRVAAAELVLLDAGKSLVRFENIALDYRLGKTMLPEDFSIAIGGVIVPPRRETQTTDAVQLHDVVVSLHAPEPADAKTMRSLDLTAALGETRLFWPEKEGSRTLLLKPFRGTATARMNNLSPEEWNQLVDGVRQKMPDWKRLGQQIETGEGEANINLMVTGVVDALLRTGIVPTSNDISWDGFSFTDEKGTVLAQMKPSQWKSAFTEAASGVQSTMDGRVGDLTLQMDAGATTASMSGGTMRGAMTYPESTYADLLGASARSAVAPAALNMRDRPLTAGAAQVASTLAQWASRGTGELAFDAMQFKSATNTTLLKKSRYMLEQDGVTLKTQIASEVGAQTLPPGLSVPQWENGAATLAFGLKTPWAAWHAVRKQLGDEKFPLEQLLTTCVQQPHEVSVGVDLRGGNLKFDVALQAAVGVDGAAITVDAAGDAEVVLRKLAAVAPQQVLPTLTTNLTLTIAQLKALRAFIDAASPGMSDQLLAQAQMFVVVDDAADKLTSVMNLKNGKWMVNGQPNPMLDLLFQEVAGK